MSYKKSLPYFFYQSISSSKGLRHFQRIWSFFPHWKSALRPGRNSVADELAWLNFAAIEFLQEYLKPTHRVFEYGGGGSTLFFCKQVAFVATVENDEDWFKVLSQKIAEKWPQKWQGFFLKGEFLENAPASDPANPAHFRSNSPGSEQLSYEKYAKAIHQFPDNHFDVVLVDGRARPSCIQESWRHLKSGGLLVVDNMERDYYWTAFRELFERDFEYQLNAKFPTPYHPDFTNTLILKKK